MLVTSFMQKQIKAISPFRTDDLRKPYYAHIRHGCGDCTTLTRTATNPTMYPYIDNRYGAGHPAYSLAK